MVREPMSEGFIAIPPRILADASVEVCPIDYGSPEFQQLVSIRMKVFVEEQKVDESAELDEYETVCTHLGLRLKDGNQFVSVCRLRPKAPFVKLERVATLKEHRGKGLAEILNKEAARISSGKWPRLILVAHAQTTALPFYRKLGYFVVSEEFEEEGIDHYTIACPLPSATYDISEYTPPADQKFCPGECVDPAVIKNIQNLIDDVQNFRVIPLHTVLSPVEGFEALLGPTFPVFQRYARNVCFLQSYKEAPVGLGKDERTLLDQGWTKLNTGHYSQVGEHWRRFYFAVCLAKSVRLYTKGEFKESLRLLDKGLMMGGRYLPKRSIVARTAHLQQRCPPHIPLICEGGIEEKRPAALEGSEEMPITGIITDEEFLEKNVLANRPVLIKDGIRHIPAVGKWSIPFLAERLAWRQFPVEMGSRYTDDSWEQHLMQAEDFFSKLIHPDSKSGVVYLAQHRLLEQVPELLDDIPIPSYCLAAGLNEKDIDINAWVGPAGTISPLHTDPKDNLFCQISGKKFFRLVSPEDSARVYPNEEGILTNTSQVDMENPDTTGFPLTKDLRCLDVVVEEGDALFIPRGWWHYVRSLTPSISLSFWFDNEF